MPVELKAVRVKLTGRYTPVLRRHTQQFAGGSESGSSGETGSTASPPVFRPPDPQARDEEADVREVFDAAVARAEREHGDGLTRSAAWRSILELLPLLAQAQALLLRAEQARCRQVEDRRGGRACRVRFLCYDLSAREPPPLADESAQTSGSESCVDEDELLLVLAKLVGLQRSLMHKPKVRLPAPLRSPPTTTPTPTRAHARAHVHAHHEHELSEEQTENGHPTALLGGMRRKLTSPTLLIAPPPPPPPPPRRPAAPPPPALLPPVSDCLVRSSPHSKVATPPPLPLRRTRAVHAGWPLCPRLCSR